MGTDRGELVKMKVFVLFTFVFSTSLAFEVNLNPKSESDRGLCCLFFNAQSDCASRCSGRSCTDRCNVNCGVANTLCGSWTCSQAELSTTRGPSRLGPPRCRGVASPAISKLVAYKGTYNCG